MLDVGPANWPVPLFVIVTTPAWGVEVSVTDDRLTVVADSANVPGAIDNVDPPTFGLAPRRGNPWLPTRYPRPRRSIRYAVPSEHADTLARTFIPTSHRTA